MYSIIRLCIVLAAVLLVQAAADIFSEVGDPNPSPTPDSVVVKKCDGCKANVDPATCTKGGNAAKCKGIKQPFQFVSGGAAHTVKGGECAQVARCDETKKGCRANDQWITNLRYPDNRDGGTKVEYEVKHPQSGVTEGEVVKKNTVLLTNVGNPTTWNCDSDLEVTFKWTRNNVPFTFKRMFTCSECK